MILAEYDFNKKKKERARSLNDSRAVQDSEITMSLGYAEKLTFRDDLGGQLGSEELTESPDSLKQKIDQLAEMVEPFIGIA